MSQFPTQHQSVLVHELLGELDPRPGQVVLDGTLGGGGHALALADRVSPAGRVIALDRDPAAIERATNKLSKLPVQCVQANFCDAPEVLAQFGLKQVDVAVLDLGLSSDQLADTSRGFSFQAAGALDLRFDSFHGEPASRLVNRLSEAHLADLIFAYGEERHSRRIAKAIVTARRKQPIETADRLAEIVRSAVPRSRDSRRIDPATRTFQALRIAVNQELKSLEIALRRFPEILAPGGRIAIISFHSLEDRRVKEAFRDDPRWQSVSRKPIRPGPAEIQANPRSRSAKMRVAVRNMT